MKSFGQLIQPRDPRSRGEPPLLVGSLRPLSGELHASRPEMQPTPRIPSREVNVVSRRIRAIRVQPLARAMCPRSVHTAAFPAVILIAAQSPLTRPLTRLCPPLPLGAACRGPRAPLGIRAASDTFGMTASSCSHLCVLLERMTRGGQKPRLPGGGVGGWGAGASPGAFLVLSAGLAAPRL